MMELCFMGLMTRLYPFLVEVSVTRRYSVDKSTEGDD